MKSFTIENEIFPRRLQQVRGGLVGTVVSQLVLGFLGASCLDGGFMNAFVWTGIITHWIVVGIIAVRRRNTLTEVDVVLVRAGYLIFSVVAFVGFLLVSMIG